MVKETDLWNKISETYCLHHVHSEGFCEAIDGVIEYTILEVNEEEIDLDQYPEFRYSLAGSKSESVLKTVELSGWKSSTWSYYDDDIDD